MPLVKRNFPDIEEFPASLRVFQDTVSRLFDQNTTRPWVPPVDIFETENELILKADLPDVNMADLDIQFENGTLTIKGERRFDREAGNGYHRVERSYGAFTRSFTLPDTIDPEKVDAKFANGVLTITVAKKEVAKPRTIKVQVNNN